MNLQGLEGDRWSDAPIRDLVIAGWTGRDQRAIEHHIRELAELGIPAPARTPIFYRVAASLMTTASAIDVIGADSTGEVEFVLLNHDGVWWVGVGSDHTDRKAEAVGVTLSKQLCAKPLAPAVWSFDSVEPHWDELILRSYAALGDGRTIYQEGPVSAIRHPRDLVELYRGNSGAEFAPGTAMFCGTLPAQGGVRWADTFIVELEDPVRKRKITHSYDCRALPIEG
ncbi:MAG: DUF2848 domain-containing protein [Bryobacteraceae bacterium]|nr:DUF2848 domain-containing protein [Bryobacteraceae bacterium]